MPTLTISLGQPKTEGHLAWRLGEARDSATADVRAGLANSIAQGARDVRGGERLSNREIADGLLSGRACLAEVVEQFETFPGGNASLVLTVVRWRTMRRFLP